jgi:hypothetical protein
LRTLDDFHAMAGLARMMTDEDRADLTRALDDLHSLAAATESLTEAERRLTAAERVVAERSAQLSVQLAEMRALRRRLEPPLLRPWRVIEVIESAERAVVPSAVRGATARLGAIGRPARPARQRTRRAPARARRR